MDLGIAGRVALVTAGSRGLGRATAVALASEGVRVVVSARTEAPLVKVVDDLRTGGAEAIYVVSDVADPSTPDRLVHATIEAFGSIDIVVANAGGPPQGRALEVGDDALIAALQSNLLSSIRLVRAARPTMQAAGWPGMCALMRNTGYSKNPSITRDFWPSARKRGRPSASRSF